MSINSIREAKQAAIKSVDKSQADLAIKFLQTRMSAFELYEIGVCATFHGTAMRGFKLALEMWPKVYSQTAECMLWYSMDLAKSRFVRKAAAKELKKILNHLETLNLELVQNHPEMKHLEEEQCLA